MQNSSYIDFQVKMGKFLDVVPLCVRYTDETREEISKEILENGVDPENELHVLLIELLRENTTSCAHWCEALRLLGVQNIDEHILSSAEGTVLTHFDWNLMEVELAEGKFLTFFIRFPFGFDHFFLVDSVLGAGAQARILHAWQDRHQLEATDPIDIPVIVGAIHMLTTLDWTDEDQLEQVRVNFTILFGEDDANHCIEEMKRREGAPVGSPYLRFCHISICDGDVPDLPDEIFDLIADSLDISDEIGEVPKIPNEFKEGEMAHLKEYELQDPQLIIAAYENDAAQADPEDFEANLSLFHSFCTYFTNALSHDEEDEEGEEED